MSSSPVSSPGAKNKVQPRRPKGTVVFIDLAGFTALTDTHGDDQAIAVVDRFESAVRRALADPACLIKFIGDAAMLVFDSPADAVGATAQIIDDCANDGFPELRVGLHHGPLTWRDDDPFGETVNLASRIAAHASGGQVLASARAASLLQGVAATPAGKFAARGITIPIQLVDIATTATPNSIDPVCQMRVSRGHGDASIVYANQRWDLCSLACAKRFTANPELYLAQLRRPVFLPGGPAAPSNGAI